MNKLVFRLKVNGKDDRNIPVICVYGYNSTAVLFGSQRNHCLLHGTLVLAGLSHFLWLSLKQVFSDL